MLSIKSVQNLTLNNLHCVLKSCAQRISFPARCYIQQGGWENTTVLLYKVTLPPLFQCSLLFSTFSKPSHFHSEITQCWRDQITRSRNLLGDGSLQRSEGHWDEEGCNLWHRVTILQVANQPLSCWVYGVSLGTNWEKHSGIFSLIYIIELERFKSTPCSCWEPRFSSHHLNCGSQSSATPVLNLAPLIWPQSVPGRHVIYKQTNRWNTHTHEIIKIR